MSENIRRFKIVFNSLKKLCPKEPTGNYARRLTTLAYLIAGTIGAKSCQLPSIATKVIDDRQADSKIKTFYRWLKNKNVTDECYFLPYAQALLSVLCNHPNAIAIAIDGSVVARNCITLMASVVYKNRALPLCWLVLTGSKGHLKESVHIELVSRLKEIIPQKAKVVFLGDGEFDGLNLIKTIKQYGWLFALRTSKNRILIERDESFSFRSVCPLHNEEYFLIPDVRFDQAGSPQFDAIVWHNKDYEDPIYLVTNLELAHESLYWYRKRFKIETMFSDKKSRGFNIHKSHISNPERVARLLIVTALAYIFIIYFGILATQNDYIKKIHRVDRCDLSLFTLGMRTLEYLLNQRKKTARSIQLCLFSP
jgi:hypothetical protein